MTTREPISIENGRVEIHTPENRVWLTRHQIADLFGVFVPAVGSNIRSILKSGILREERVYRRERNRDGGIVELYSLEMIAALAFRLKSGNAEAFRRWLVRRATTTAVVWQLPGMNTILNRVGGKRSSFLPTFVFRPLTPPYVRFRIRRFLFWVPFEVRPY